MTTISATFTEPDGTTVTGWVEVSGDWTIASNRLTPGTAGGTGVIRNATALATDDHYAQVAIPVAASVSCGVWCRGDATLSSGYLWRNDGASWDLFRVLGGSFLSIGTFAGAAVSGDVAKVQAVGSTIKGFVNGVERVSVTDTDVATGKNVGLRCESSAVVRYDDFAAADIGGAGTVNATMALDGGAGSAALTATRTVYATMSVSGGAGTLAAAGKRTVAATAALGGGNGGLAMTGSTSGELALPNATIVAKAWLTAIGFDPTRVASELPRRADWPGPIDGFTTVLPLINNGEQYVPLQHPVIQFDCWAAFGGSTKKPNHGTANDLAERIRAAAESTMWEVVPEVALPPGVMPVWLSSIDIIRGVQRIPDDHYAHYSLDVHIGWIERERLAGVTG